MTTTVFKVRRSTVAGKAPNTSNIDTGELAVNLADGIMYTSDGSSVFEIGANNTNVRVSQRLTVNTISANGTTGATNHVLASDGSRSYWADPNNIMVLTANQAAVYNWTNYHTFNQDVTFNQDTTIYTLKASGSTGSAGQILVANGSGGISWANIPSTKELHVSKAGNDVSGDGSLNNPYFTIKKALSVATSGTTIYVENGDYQEDNPLVVPAGVAIYGNSLRGVNVSPQNPTSDIFHLNNGTYVKEVTVKNYYYPAAAFAFPTGGAGNITRSPYVLNCTSLQSNGYGLLIDGSKAGGTKSIIAGLYTILNENGIGVAISNRGYSQLVNIYTICANQSVICTDGGFCSLNCSDTTFGNYGLIADGTLAVTEPELADGVTVGDQFGSEFTISGLTKKPYINGAIVFANSPTEFHTIVGVADGIGGDVIVRTMDTILDIVPDGTEVSFYHRSYISASGHTFEYSGSGTTLSTAIPYNGGVSNTERQIVQTNGGVVNYTSTDQFGNFNIGTGLNINGQTSTIEGDTFQKSLFAIMTPYILSIEGS